MKECDTLEIHGRSSATAVEYSVPDQQVLEKIRSSFFTSHSSEQEKRAKGD